MLIHTVIRDAATAASVLALNGGTLANLWCHK